MKRLTDEIDHKVLLPLESTKIQVSEEGDTCASRWRGSRATSSARGLRAPPGAKTTVEMLAQYSPAG